MTLSPYMCPQSPYMWTLKIKDTNELTYKTERDSQTQRMNLQLPGGRKWGKGQGVWDGHVHTAILKMDNQQGPFVQYRELCSMLYSSLDRRGVWRRMDTCVCMAESHGCSLETITTLLISYIPYTIKSLEKKKLQRIKIKKFPWN